MTQTATHYQSSQSPAAPTLHFCPLEAEALGLAEAIVIARLRFWLGRSKHHFGGKPWVYNTYPDWREQFPFWSVFTVKSIFRRLEKLAVLESTQRFNTSRWNKTKWYTLNEDVLAEMMGHAVATEAAEPVVMEATPTEAVSMGAEVTMDRQQPPAIDGVETAPIDEVETAPIDGVEITPCLKTVKNTKKTPKSARASEPDAGALTLALEDRKPEHPKAEEKAETELDAAYEAIPEAERATWVERADRALAAAGMPEWMRIVPTVKEMALRLWVGETIPAFAPG